MLSEYNTVQYTTYNLHTELFRSISSAHLFQISLKQSQNCPKNASLMSDMLCIHEIEYQHSIRSLNIVTSSCPVNLEYQVHFLMNPLLPPSRALPVHICVSEYLLQNLLHVNGMPMCMQQDKLCTYVHTRSSYPQSASN